MDVFRVWYNPVGSVHQCTFRIDYIIQREAPRCSFYLDGHMPEPRIAERVTDTDSHAFILYNYLIVCRGSLLA